MLEFTTGACVRRSHSKLSERALAEQLLEVIIEAQALLSTGTCPHTENSNLDFA